MGSDLDPGLWQDTARILTPRRIQSVAEWSEENLTLVPIGYRHPGPLRLKPWQVEMVNAPQLHRNVCYCGPSQAGKSLCSDCNVFYDLAHDRSVILAYNSEAIVQSVMQTRIIPMIKKNPALLELTTGRADDLAQGDIILKNARLRVCTAGTEGQIQTFGADRAVGSEVSKWRTAKATESHMNYNPLELMRQRGGAKHGAEKIKCLWESTLFDIGDYFHREVFSKGSIILTPHFKHAACGHWIVFTDRYIAEIPTEAGDHDHDPQRILRTGAAVFACPHCGQEISEGERVRMSERCLWKADQITEGDFEQPAETITGDRVDGSETRNGRYSTLVYNFNRLVNTDFSFAECLSEFFKARYDSESLRVYLTDCMAIPYHRESASMSAEFIRSHIVGYRMSDPISPEVLLLTAGCDTQNDGIWWMVVGWLAGGSWRVIRYGFAAIGLFEDIGPGVEIFRASILSQPYIRPNGVNVQIVRAFIDRGGGGGGEGGDRPDLVDAIADSMGGGWSAYIGDPKLDYKKPMVYPSPDSKPWYLGQSERLSALTSAMLQGTEGISWELPEDIGSDIVKQLPQQRHEERVVGGKTTTRWIRGRADHLRDCLNMALGATYECTINGVTTYHALRNPEILAPFVAQQQAAAGQVPSSGQPKPSQPPTQRRIQPTRRAAGYFDRAIRGFRASTC
jgi:phage terminase large subunit GpA-like protein